MNKGERQIQIIEITLQELLPSVLIHLVSSYIWKFEWIHETLIRRSWSSLDTILYVTHYEDKEQKKEVPFSVPLIVNYVYTVTPMAKMFWLSQTEEKYQENLALIALHWEKLEIQFCGCLYSQEVENRDQWVWKTMDLCRNKIMWCTNVESGTTIRGRFLHPELFPTLLVEDSFINQKE